MLMFSFRICISWYKNNKLYSYNTFLNQSQGSLNTLQYKNNKFL